MANTFVVSRNHLIFGLCLPLAVLLGYLLADPLESSSLAIVVMVLSVLVVPLLMSWHHPLLILSWNAMINPGFFPGRPYLWMILAFVSLLLSVLGRAVNPTRKFLLVPEVTWPLACLGVVVFLTACVTGGFGMRAMGAEHFGGKGYVYIFAAVAGYFALTGQVIPPQRAQLYLALFFLSGFTAMVSNLAWFAGPSFFFLYNWFPPELAADQAMGSVVLGDATVRISGLMMAAFATHAFLLARYGVVGVFDLKRPWRLALFLGAGIASLYGGFRGAVMFQVATFAILFVVEGLWRTRYLFFVLCLALVGGALLVSFVDQMPLSAQRAVSFLPVKVDPLTKQSAEDSVEWRLELWRGLLPEVPKYFFKGKGYALDPQELWSLYDVSNRGDSDSAAIMAYAGNYHNGALSVIIPFGVYGMVAFLWFLGAGAWVLRQNYRHGDPALHAANAFLFACFITRVLFFFLVFGALYNDLFHFTGLVGLSVSLNGGVRRLEGEKDGAVDLM